MPVKPFSTNERSLLTTHFKSAADMFAEEKGMPRNSPYFKLLDQAMSKITTEQETNVKPKEANLCIGVMRQSQKDRYAAIDTRMPAMEWLSLTDSQVAKLAVIDDGNAVLLKCGFKQTIGTVDIVPVQYLEVLNVLKKIKKSEIIFLSKNRRERLLQNRLRFRRPGISRYRAKPACVGSTRQFQVFRTPAL